MRITFAVIASLCVVGVSFGQDCITSLDMLYTPAEDDEFLSTDDILLWTSQLKGFGNVEWTEMRVWFYHIIVTWFCPFSGRDTVFSNTFYFDSQLARWIHIETLLHELPTLSYVSILPHEDKLVFYDDEGMRINELDLVEYKYLSNN